MGGRMLGNEGEHPLVPKGLQGPPSGPGQQGGKGCQEPPFPVYLVPA